MNLFFFLVFASLLIKNSLPIPAPLQTKTYLRRQHGLPAALTSHYLYMFPPQWPVCHQKSSRRFVFIPNFLNGKSSTFSIPVFVAVSICSTQTGICTVYILSQTPVWDSFSRNRVWDSFRGSQGSQTPMDPRIRVWDSFWDSFPGIPDSRVSQDPSLRPKHPRVDPPILDPSKSPRQNGSVGLFSVLLYTTNLIYDMYIQQAVYTKFINKPYNNTFSMFLLYTTNLIYDMYI